MKPAEWERVKELFWAAVRRAPGERSAFLRDACGANESLRAEVESLLASHERGDSFTTPPLRRTSRQAFMDALLGKNVGAYELIREIGHGGMATVFLARDRRHDRQVALKILHPELAVALGPERFLREIRLTAHLQHPHILPLHDSGEAEGFLYYVMPYVEGESLRHRLLRDRQLPLDEALAIAREVADALSYAHSRDVVHRDIKPENILLASGHALVADFGIARAITAAGGERLTRSGLTIGTPGYMSPEQASGSSHLDGRSDQYSLACVLYEMLAGEPPYTGPSAQAIVAKQLTEPLPHIRTVRAVPEGVEAALTKALAKVAADRFPTISGFAVALEKSEAPAQRRPARAVIGASLSLLLLIGLIVGMNVGELRTRLLHSDTATGASRVHGTPVKARRSVAVLGFKNLSGRSDADWLSAALSGELATELAAGEKLRMIPGEDISPMKRDLSLPDAESYGSETLARIRKRTGADIVVLGSYVELGKQIGGQIRLDLRLQDTRSGATVAALSTMGTEASFFDLVSITGVRLRQALGIGGVPAAEVARLEASLPSSQQAARFYSEGLTRLRRFDALGARNLLQQAVAAEPRYALGHAALADAWTLLGYTQKAQDEARAAFDLSSDLPREQRLVIEGRYREYVHEWDKAVDIERTLFGFFPDNLEYGLRLTSAQYSAGQAKDALTTVAALRRLPPPMRDDPRIDLAEVNAADALGDFPREQAAAERAAAKAEAEGATLVLAQALRDQAWALQNLGDLNRAAAKALEAKQIYDSAGIEFRASAALSDYGLALLTQGELGGALGAYQEALAVARRLGNRGGEVVAANQIANILYRQGKLAEARGMYERVLTILQELGNKDYSARVNNNIAGVLTNEGDLAGATRMYERAVALQRQIGNKAGTALTLGNLANVLRDRGELDSAKQAYDEALLLFRQTGSKTGEAYVRSNRAELLKIRGDLDAARKAEQEALAIRETAGEMGGIAASELSLAELALEQGRPADADTAARNALREFQVQKESDDEVRARVVLARALLAEGRARAAQDDLDLTAALVTRSQNPAVRLEYGIRGAQVRAASRTPADWAAATRDLEQALTIAKRDGFLGYEYEALLTLGEIEQASGRASTGRSRLRQLEDEAAVKGFGLVAAKAAGALKER